MNRQPHNSTRPSAPELARVAELVASGVTELQLDATLDSVDPLRRTITGTLIPAGQQLGSTSAGPTRFLTGSLGWTELRRVKLLREHQHADSLGHAIRLEWTPEGALVGTFWVAPGPSGDRALVEAQNGVRDGFSVGAADLITSRDSDGALVVAGGKLREGSLCSVPAYDDSRVSRVVATQRGNAMHCTVCGTVHTPGTPCAVTAPAAPAPAAVQAAQPAAAPAPAAPAGVAPAAIAGRTGDELLAQLVDMIRAGNVNPIPAQPTGSAGAAPAPGGAPAQGGRELGLTAFCELLVANSTAMMQGDTSHVHELQAALSDIVPADNPAAFRPTYLNELWSGAQYVRKFIDNATTVRPLGRTMKIIGHRWVTPPEVADYAGDKGDVPSNDAVMEDVEVAVARMAGAHDVDRIYVDLGDPQWWAEYFDAMTESYKKKSDAKAAALAWAATADATTAAPTTLLAGVVGAAIDIAANGEPVDYVAMHLGQIAGLLGIKQSDAPAFLSGSFSLGTPEDGGLGGLTFFGTPGITTAGGVIVGNKAATRWHENGVPIRVQAENIAKGGVDVGVFGYYATYERSDAGKRKFVVTP